MRINKAKIANQRNTNMHLCVKNFSQGWRLVVVDDVHGTQFGVGPYFNSTTEAWAWQSKNFEQL